MDQGTGWEGKGIYPDQYNPEMAAVSSLGNPSYYVQDMGSHAPNKKMCCLQGETEDVPRRKWDPEGGVVIIIII